MVAWLWGCWGLAATAWAQPAQLDLPNQTVSQYYVLDYATNWVRAAQGFVVNGSASVAFNAGNQVYLEPGFHATGGTGAGAVFHAYIGAIPSMPPTDKVTPASGTGPGYVQTTFAFTGSSPYGFQDIGVFDVIINSTQTAVNGCYLHYMVSSNTLLVRDDTNLYWVQGGNVGSQATIQNSQCSVNLAASSGPGMSPGAGTDAVLSLAITFKPNQNFGGTQQVFLQTTQAGTGMALPYQQVGTWAVTGGAPQQYTLTSAVSPSGSGYLTFSPQCCTYNAGTQVAITANANPNSGYQFSGWNGVDFSYQSTGYVTMNGNRSVTAYFTPTGTQYQLTTSVSGSGGGTVSPSCPGGCSYGSGSQVTITAVPANGYQSNGFTGSLSGGSRSMTVVMNGAVTETASFTATPLAPLTLPSPLAGFNYFPSGHAWYDMFYDWYTYDCATNSYYGTPGCTNSQTVRQLVNNDLTWLSQNHVNLIHLYIWDKAAINRPSPPPGLGFSYPTLDRTDCNYLTFRQGDEGSCQYSALKEFVGWAKDAGIYLHIDFVPSGVGAGDGANFAAWVNQFISDLGPKGNVLVWGTFGLGPQPDQTQFWHDAYTTGILPKLQQYPTIGKVGTAPGRALFAANSGFEIHGDVKPRLRAYSWPWADVQQLAYNFRSKAGFVPDLFSFQLYNANADDLASNLQCLAGTPVTGFCRAASDYSNPALPVTPAPICGSGSDPCDTVQAGQIIATEYATGSSADAAPAGNGVLSYGDADTPTTTKAGQQKWLADTLCVIRKLNLPSAYFGLYDSASFWVKNQYGLSPFALAWDGYWGLIAEITSPSTTWAPPQTASKLAWSAMSSYLNGSLSCSAPAPTPVLAIQTDAPQYSLLDWAKVSYTAGNVNALQLNVPISAGWPSQSCDTGFGNSPLAYGSLVGSCAFMRVQITDPTLTSFTLTPTDDSGNLDSQSSVSTAISVSPRPVISSVVNSSGQYLPIGTHDYITIWGAGFSPSGGNIVTLTGPAPAQPIFVTEASNQALGLDFWDLSSAQINVELGSAGSGFSLVTPGQWTVSVTSPANPSLPSAVFAFTVVSQ